MTLRAAGGRTSVDDTIAALFEEQYTPLVRLASLLIDDVGACEELVQDAFVQLHVHWGRLRDPASAPAWLRSAVMNAARSRLRHRRVVARYRPEPQRHIESAETTAMVGDRQRAVLDALRTLPQRQREALALRFYLDLSEAEIAQTMGISTGSVKTHVHRGLASLSAALEDR